MISGRCWTPLVLKILSEMENVVFSITVRDNKCDFGQILHPLGTLGLRVPLKNLDFCEFQPPS